MQELTSSDPLFWQRLERLRKIFLSREGSTGNPSKGAAAGTAVYWADEADLAAYDKSLGRRIFQKWKFLWAQVPEDVLSEVLASSEGVLDWGCGSGVAMESLLEKLSEKLPEKLSAEGAQPSGHKAELPRLEFFDHSQNALNFCEQKFGDKAHTKSIAADKRFELSGRTVLISHVLNELSNSEMNHMLNALKQAQAVFWVEAGSRETSRKLSAARDVLLKQDSDFEVLFPCPSSRGACGVLAEGNESHWCHFFAEGDPVWHQDPDWAEFAKRMKVDLRALPLSALVLVRKQLVQKLPVSDVSDLHEARALGAPRVYKGYMKMLACMGEGGVHEATLEKKLSKAVFKQLSKGLGRDNSLTRLRWKLDPEKSKIVEISVP